MEEQEMAQRKFCLHTYQTGATGDKTDYLLPTCALKCKFGCGGPIHEMRPPYDINNLLLLLLCRGSNPVPLSIRFKPM
jgi:hypothetical protein